jgi:arylsulfatase A-like enzyme
MPTNILFVLCDQMRAEALQYAPNVRALADRGATFTNCYTAAPLCQPARACIATGRSPTEHGVCGNMNQPVPEQMRADTYMSHLQRAGYHTTLVGKHHLLDRFNVGMDVTEDDETVARFGFDDVWQVVDIYESFHNEDRFTAWLKERGRLEKWRGLAQSQGQQFYRRLAPEETVDGFIGECALESLRAHEGDAPFYLNVGFVGPHPPYWAPEHYAERFAAEDMPAPRGVEDPDEIKRAQHRRALSAAAVALIDDYVGRMVDVLDERGRLEDTLIVFTADHGDLLGDFGINDKRWFYEGSARIPLVMAGPGVETDPRLGGITCRQLASNVDLYPTFLQAAGLEHADESREGRSLLDAAADHGGRRQRVFSELGTAMMVRDATHKLVYDPEQGGVVQLFDLRRDPHELENLAGVPGLRTAPTRRSRTACSAFGCKARVRRMARPRRTPARRRSSVQEEAPDARSTRVPSSLTWPCLHVMLIAPYHLMRLEDPRCAKALH